MITLNFIVALLKHLQKKDAAAAHKPGKKFDQDDTMPLHKVFDTIEAQGNSVRDFDELLQWLHREGIRGVRLPGTSLGTPWLLESEKPLKGLPCPLPENYGTSSKLTQKKGWIILQISFILRVGSIKQMTAKRINRIEVSLLLM